MRFKCPRCGKMLQAPDEKAGTVVRCPGCKDSLTVPGAEKTAPVEPPPPLPQATEPTDQAGSKVDLLNKVQSIVPILKKYPPIAVGGAGVFLLFSCLCCGAFVFFGSGDGKPIVISATDLIDEYADNEARADENYKNKLLELTGTVDRVTNKAVVLKSNRTLPVKFLWINCYLADRTQLKKVSSGQSVTIRGVCYGKEQFGPFISVKKAKLIE